MDSSILKIQQYALLFQLGHSAEYQAYLAREEKSERLCTLRQLRQDSDLVARGPLEAVLKELCQTRHLGLPRVSDFGIDNGTLYWVCEYVEGDSLDTLERRSRQIPVPIALRLALDLSEALAVLTELGHSGPVLREDVWVSVSGRPILIPPLSWASGPRLETKALVESLTHIKPTVAHVVAFLWDAMCGVTLSSCLEGNDFPLISSFGASTPPELERLLSDVLSGRARFEQLSTFTTVLSNASTVATHDEVRSWLLSLIGNRLQGRANVLRSKIPSKPSGEIPLVRFPADLNAVRLATAANEAAVSARGAGAFAEGSLEGDVLFPREATERPAPLPTLRTPQPFPPEQDADGPASPVRSSAESGEHSSANAERELSSIPASSVRDAAGKPPETDSTVGQSKPARAPLESALAEYAERLSKDRSSSS